MDNIYYHPKDLRRIRGNWRRRFKRPINDKARKECERVLFGREDREESVFEPRVVLRKKSTDEVTGGLICPDPDCPGDTELSPGVTDKQEPL